MTDFLYSAAILFDQFTLDTARSRGRDRDAPEPSNSSSSQQRRTGYNPSQARGGDGRWVETGRNPNSDRTADKDFDPDLFDENSAIGRAYKKQQEELAKNALETEPVVEKKKELPKEVEVEDLGRGGAQYTHETKNGNTLEVLMIPTSDGKSKSVDFMINGEMDKADNLSPDEANRISIKIAKIMQFDASQREDGDRYQTSAYTDDSEEYAAVRAYAYEKIAKFSRPVGGAPGGLQYAIVKNGKLEPDIKRVLDEEREEQMAPMIINENIRESTAAAENYRRNRRGN